MDGLIFIIMLIFLVCGLCYGAGVGTVVSLMIPYTLIIAVAWTLFFVAWYLLGIPLGPGAPVHLP